jgi:DNA-binding Xre family transcriptional regulator
MFKGQRIIDLLIDRRKKKKDLYEYLGITPVGLDSIIKGSNVRAGNLEKIADFFKVPIDFFFDRDVYNLPEEQAIEGEENKHEEMSVSQENIYLKRILEEKERTIQILLSQKKQS